MKLKEDIKPVTYAEAQAVSLLLHLALQAETDFQEGRFMSQEEALSRLRLRLQK